MIVMVAATLLVASYLAIGRTIAKKQELEFIKKTYARLQKEYSHYYSSETMDVHGDEIVLSRVAELTAEERLMTTFFWPILMVFWLFDKKELRNKQRVATIINNNLSSELKIKRLERELNIR